MTAPDKPEGLIAGGEQVRAKASHNTPPAEEDRGERVLADIERQKAERRAQMRAAAEGERFQYLLGRPLISPAELLDLLDEIDRLLSSPRAEGERALEEAAKVVTDAIDSMKARHARSPDVDISALLLTADRIYQGIKRLRTLSTG